MDASARHGTFGRRDMGQSVVPHSRKELSHNEILQIIHLSLPPQHLQTCRRKATILRFCKVPQHSYQHWEWDTLWPARFLTRPRRPHSTPSPARGRPGQLIRSRNLERPSFFLRADKLPASAEIQLPDQQERTNERHLKQGTGGEEVEAASGESTLSVVPIPHLT